MRARVLAVVVGLLVLLPVPAAADDWVWPVAGPQTVLRPFAPPETRYGPGHRGADLAAPPGAAVRAAGAGRVSYAGLLAGRGVVVVVHGELRTTYEPVVASVRVGAIVAAGAVLGGLARGGHCAAGCLHWGLLRGDVYLDPVQLVRRGPSRLLPVGADSARAAPVPAAPVPAAPGPAAPGRAAPARPAARPAALRPVAEPGLSLRAAQAPWGATAVVALIAGLALLRRPSSRPPRRPPAAAAAAVHAGAAAPTAEAPAAELVDLAAERSRRRVG